MTFHVGIDDVQPSTGDSAAPREWYRDKNWLVVPIDATPPSICVRCGAPAACPAKAHTFYWHSPWFYYALFLGVFPYALLLALVHEKCEIRLPRCDYHKRRRRLIGIAAVANLVGAIPVGIALDNAGFSDQTVIFIILGLLGLGAVLLSFSRTSLRPLFMDKEVVALRGAGKDFLSSLAPCPPDLVGRLVWPTLSRWISIGVALLLLGIAAVSFAIAAVTGKV